MTVISSLSRVEVPEPMTAIGVRQPMTSAAGAWRRSVHELRDPHLAHSHELAAVIHHAYGHEPLYLAADDGPGRLGVLTPSERHVPQTIARWRACGFDAHVAPLSPYEENDPVAVRRAAETLRAGNAGLVVMDCIGFRRKTRDEVAALTGAPTLVANLLVARVAAELLGR